MIARQMSFAVHGVGELSLTGAAAALLLGVSVNLGGVGGAVVAAAIFGFLGNKARERDSVIGVLMAFGLGLGVLFIALYDGRTTTAFALLTGQVVSVTTSGLVAAAVTAVIVLTGMAIIYRPLLFASLDPRVAQAHGVPMRLLSVVFAVLMALAVAQAVQIIGALLVMSLMITPRPPHPASVRTQPSSWASRSCSPRSPPSAESSCPWHPACPYRCSSPPSRS